MINTIKNEKGMTLIEVLGAAFLLSIAVLSIIALSQFSFGSNHRTDLEASALHYAEKKLNETRFALLTEGKSAAEIVQSGTFPEQPSFRYHIDIIPFTGHQIDLPNPFSHRNIVSMQSVAYTPDGPSLIHVTVSWGDAA